MGATPCAHSPTEGRLHSGFNGSPTVWEDDDCYVVQGSRVTDAATIAEIGEVPPHETVVRIPKRMMQFLSSPRSPQAEQPTPDEVFLGLLATARESAAHLE